MSGQPWPGQGRVFRVGWRCWLVTFSDPENGVEITTARTSRRKAQEWCDMQGIAHGCRPFEWIGDGQVWSGLQAPQELSASPEEER